MACEGYPFTVATDPYSIRDRPAGVAYSYGQVLSAQRPLSLFRELSNTWLIQKIVCISTEHKISCTSTISDFLQPPRKQENSLN